MALHFYVRKKQSICNKIAFRYFAKIVFREKKYPKPWAGIKFVHFFGSPSAKLETPHMDLHSEPQFNFISSPAGLTYSSFPISHKVLDRSVWFRYLVILVPPNNKKCQKGHAILLGFPGLRFILRHPSLHQETIVWLTLLTPRGRLLSRLEVQLSQCLGDRKLYQSSFWYLIDPPGPQATGSPVTRQAIIRLPVIRQLFLTSRLPDNHWALCSWVLGHQTPVEKASDDATRRHQSQDDRSAKQRSNDRSSKHCSRKDWSSWVLKHCSVSRLTSRSSSKSTDTLEHRSSMSKHHRRGGTDLTHMIPLHLALWKGIDIIRKKSAKRHSSVSIEKHHKRRHVSHRHRSRGWKHSSLRRPHKSCKKRHAFVDTETVSSDRG